MRLIIYLDLIFLTNVCFDAAIVIMTAKVRGIQIHVWRTCAAVLLGGSYVLFMFHPSFAFMYTIAAKLIFSLLVVWTAFGFGSLQFFLRNVGAFYLIHFAAAGGVFAIHFLLLSSGDVMNRLLLQPSGSIAFAVESGLWLSVPVFLCSLWLFRSVFVSKVRTDAMLTYRAEVEVVIAGTIISCTGLIDTGNQLYDPLTRMPVMVMESEAWREVLPQSWMRLIRNQEVDRIFSELDQASFPWRDRLRLVPYRGVNSASQFMLALKPDHVIIRTDNQRYETSRVLVALDSGNLSSGEGYQAIIHPTMVTAG